MKHHVHSPYVEQRETLDNGFSKGWGFHFQPSEEYVIDAHAHMLVESGEKEEICDTLNRWFSYTEAYRMQKIVALITRKNQFEAYSEVAKEDSRLSWMFWPDINEPDLDAVKKAVSLGACGLKLHNHKIMKGEAPLGIWESNEWEEIFAYLNENKVPILWHLTQRVSYSPYHGGGYNPYFSEGAEKGIYVTNHQMMEQFERIMEKFPNIPMIAAHQCYLGLPEMAKLLDKYPQLTFDTTVGFYMRWCDTIYEEDREVYYDFFMKYSDRLLFGTDTDLKPDTVNHYQVEAFKCHLRFIHQLRLPDNELQNICWKNAERILKLESMGSARKYNARP